MSNCSRVVNTGSSVMSTDLVLIPKPGSLLYNLSINESSGCVWPSKLCRKFQTANRFERLSEKHWYSKFNFHVNREKKVVYPYYWISVLIWDCLEAYAPKRKSMCSVHSFVTCDLLKHEASKGCLDHWDVLNWLMTLISLHFEGLKCTH